MNVKQFLFIASIFIGTMSGCGIGEKVTETETKDTDSSQSNSTIQDDYFENDTLKTLQTDVSKRIKQVENDVFGEEENRNDYGTFYLDREKEQYVVGLLEDSAKAQEFREALKDTIEDKWIRFETVSYTTNTLHSKMSVVYDDVKEFAKDKRNNFHVASDISNNQINLVIDHLTEDEQAQLYNKFGDMLSITIDEEQNELTKKANEQEISEQVSEDEITVGMTAEKFQYPITTEIVKLTVRNTGDVPLLFGTHYTIQKKIDGTWYEVPFDNGAFNDIGLSISPGNTYEEEVHLTGLDYTLTEGTYRVVKSFDQEDKDHDRFKTVRVAATFDLVP
ncbi:MULTISPECIES: immunoglobulin-like domain-containing protein [Pontibacillus]|uniref:Bacterial Ig-like domain-containing protein n=1 Tax=Pontibacillus chungwhensis TaxID=265426 RepID=A0ABY8UTB9_9BACI|nr:MULTISPECIES: immunoglobulin-like domain-containing protein [Pontibacillus]MCD5323188.1 hypothetical protein [Pontibacillus sp. HN14]WIF96575.1 hypothetical protein QNI29_12520 [Pontibacillus chungwhensis]